MLDSNPLRRIILDTLKRDNDCYLSESVSRDLGSLCWHCSPRVGIYKPDVHHRVDDNGNLIDHFLTDDYPSFGELILKDQITFFQFYLTKGLIYSYLAHLKSEGIFWLFQSTGLHEMSLDEYCIDGDIPRAVSTMWLFEIVPSFQYMLFIVETVSLEDYRELSKYDNVREGVLGSIHEELIRSDNFPNLAPLRAFL